MKVFQFLKKRQSRLFLLSALAVCSTLPAHADIKSGLQQATTTIKGYVPLVQNLLYGIAGVVFLIGVFVIFTKMSNDEQDVKKSIMMLFGGVLFLVIAGALAPTLF